MCVKSIVFDSFFSFLSFFPIQMRPIRLISPIHGRPSVERTNERTFVGRIIIIWLIRLFIDLPGKMKKHESSSDEEKEKVFFSLSRIHDLCCSKAPNVLLFRFIGENDRMTFVFFLSFFPFLSQSRLLCKSIECRSSFVGFYSLERPRLFFTDLLLCVQPWPTLYKVDESKKASSSCVASLARINLFYFNASEEQKTSVGRQSASRKRGEWTNERERGLQGFSFSPAQHSTAQHSTRKGGRDGSNQRLLADSVAASLIKVLFRFLPLSASSAFSSSFSVRKSSFALSLVQCEIEKESRPKSNERGSFF